MTPQEQNEQLMRRITEKIKDVLRTEIGIESTAVYSEAIGSLLHNRVNIKVFIVPEIKANAWINTPEQLQDDVLFRGKSIATGEYVTGNYHHNLRKGVFHAIYDKDTNEETRIYRESLQIKIGENWNKM